MRSCRKRYNEMNEYVNVYPPEIVSVSQEVDNRLSAWLQRR